MHDKDEESDDTTEDNVASAKSENIFQCPEEGCIKAYQKEQNLLQHLIMGNHKLKPLRLTLRDAAIDSYKRHLETVSITPRFAT